MIIFSLIMITVAPSVLLLRMKLKFFSQFHYKTSTKITVFLPIHKNSYFFLHVYVLLFKKCYHNNQKVLLSLYKIKIILLYFTNIMFLFFL